MDRRGPGARAFRSSWWLSRSPRGGGFGCPGSGLPATPCPTIRTGSCAGGLLGSVLGPLGLNDSYGEIAAIGIAVTVALVAAACAWAWRRRSTSANLLLGLWFLGPFGGYLFHVTGYPEQLIFLLFLIGIWTRSAAVLVGLVAAALYVHELAAVLLVPTTLVLVAERRGLRAAAVAGVALAAAFLPLLLAGGAGTEAMMALQAKMAGVFGDSARPTFVAVFGAPLGERLLSQRLPSLVWVLLWSAPFLLAVAACCGRGRPLGRAGLAAVLLAPFLLGIFGTDVERWALMAAALGLLHALRCVGDEPPVSPRVVVLGATLLWVAQFELRYFDDLEPRRLTPRGAAGFVESVYDGSLFAMPAR